MALRAAARALGNYRLTGSSLYVTVEPCLMCVGAMIHARIARVVFGAPSRRPARSYRRAARTKRPGSITASQVTGGVLEEECRRVMQAFFEAKGDSSQLPASSFQLTAKTLRSSSNAPGSERLS